MPLVTETLLLTSAVAAGVLAVATSVSIEVHRRRVMRAVRGIPLENVVWTLFPTQSATGEVDIDGFRVEMRVSNRGTRVVVSKHGSLPPTLRLEGNLLWIDEIPRSERIETGDGVFDETVCIRGVRATALALLDHETRAAVLLLVRDRKGWVAGGTVHDASLHTPPELMAIARSTLDLARRLSIADGPSLLERLVKNAASDPLEGVRLRNLQSLVSSHPDAPETRKVCEGALHDPSPFVRLEGARALGREAIDVLETLATDKSLPEDVIAGALGGFALHGPAEKAAPVLVDALRYPLGPCRLAAIEQLGNLRHRPAIGPLIVLLENGLADRETAAAAARALGAIEGEECEAALVRALSCGVAQVQMAAAEVLGQSGSVNAVAPLLAASRRLFEDTFRHAARDAARRIQGRLVGAAAGQVALAEVSEPAGDLALVDDEKPRGELALAEDETETPRQR